MCDQRAGAGFSFARAQDQHAHIGVLAHMGQNFRHGLAFADDQLGVDILTVAHPFREDFVMHGDPLALFLAHQLAHADPVIELVWRNDRQNRNTSARMGRTHGGEPHRVQAFAAVIQNYEKLAHRCPPKRDYSARAVGECLSFFCDPAS